MVRSSRWVNDANPSSSTDHMFTDRYLGRDNAEGREFVFRSGVAELAGRAMGSEADRFYFDHLFVKDPQTRAVTPWHQDLPYWPFGGRQMCSVWVTLTEAAVEESA